VFQWIIQNDKYTTKVFRSVQAEQIPSPSTASGNGHCIRAEQDSVPNQGSLWDYLPEHPRGAESDLQPGYRKQRGATPGHYIYPEASCGFPPFLCLWPVRDLYSVRPTLRLTHLLDLGLVKL